MFRETSEKSPRRYDVMIALTGASIFDGQSTHQSSALVLDEGTIAGIFDQDNIPENCEVVKLDGGLLAPGYVDLQVNGGGGVLFNENPSVEAIQAICAAHSKFGTTSLLPTLITDSDTHLDLAIEAGIEAARRKVPGFLGLHLEGPHLSVAKKGAHDAKYIKPMDAKALAKVLAAKARLPHLMITVSPDAVTTAQIAELASAGVIVSLGHSNATFAQAQSAISAGAVCITHLFNAMSPLGHREPGMVGAALQSGAVHAGLIADGFHVHTAAISIALAAKKGPGRIFLVTDAMSTIGTDLKSFSLNGRTIWRKNGRLELDDGTLAGADLDMNSAVKFMRNNVGVGWQEALRMASRYAARCIGCDDTLGSLERGYTANVIHLDKHNTVDTVWIAGRRQRSRS